MADTRDVYRVARAGATRGIGGAARKAGEIYLAGATVAAAKNVLQRHMEEDLCSKLRISGETLSERTESNIRKFKIEDVLNVSGHPTWKFLNWSGRGDYSADEIKTYFMQEVISKGVLVLSTHNVTLAHTPKIVERISDIYSELLNMFG